MGAKAYRDIRTAGEVPQAKEHLITALDVLSKAGTAIDAVFIQAEQAQAQEEDRGLHSLMEETVTTLRSMSKSVWEAVSSAQASLAGLRQLKDVEIRLDTNLTELINKGKI